MNDDDAQALTVTQPAELSLARGIPASVLVARKKDVLEVMRDVMVEGQHYGTIPGCGPKPVLLLPGAQVLLLTLQLAPTYRIERRDLDGGHREYEVVSTLTHIPTGTVVAQGIGLCSTQESRYRWRKADRTCPDCGKATIIRGRADYGGGWLCFAKKGGCGSKWPDGAREIEGQTVGRVENPDLPDVFNTILKISKKRALVDAVLTATAASDLWTQDLEDLGPVDDHEPPARPEPARREPRTERSAPAEAMHEPGEEWVIDMIGRLDEAETVEALKRLAPAINKMTPSGSPSRKACRRAYDEAMARLTK